MALFDIDFWTNRVNELTTWKNLIITNSKRIFQLPASTTGTKLVAVHNETSGETEQFNLTEALSSITIGAREIKLIETSSYDLISSDKTKILICEEAGAITFQLDSGVFSANDVVVIHNEKDFTSTIQNIDIGGQDLYYNGTIVTTTIDIPKGSMVILTCVSSSYFILNVISFTTSSQDLESVTTIGNTTTQGIGLSDSFGNVLFNFYMEEGEAILTFQNSLFTKQLQIKHSGFAFYDTILDKVIYLRPNFEKPSGIYNIATTDDLESKADLVGGLVPSSQLPATVDEILEGTYINSTTFNDESSSPYTPSSNKYYLDLTTYKTYRWSGSVYTPMNEGLVLGETSSTAYRGDRGKTAYDHSQETGNPHGTTAAQVGAYSTTESDSALALKADKTIQETIISSGTTTLDFAFNSFGKTTQTGNIIIDGVNLTGTKKIEKSFLIQGSTNASHTITFPNNWTNLSGVSADSTKMNFIEIALINESVVYSINKYDIPDLIAPTLLKSSILLDALNTIELLYSEAIDSSVTTQTSWFNVVGKTVSSVTILSNKVRIVVSVPFTETDSTLVTFTNQVTGNGIQDASGNKVADFSQTIGVTTYRFDNFNRANSTTSINSPSDGGSDWVTPFGAVWGINSNKGYCFGANTTTATAHGVLLETNESNVILRKKVTYGTTGISSSAFFLRYTDNNNNYIVQFGKQNTGQLFYSVFKVVGGVLSILVNNTNFGTWVSGTEYTFMVKCSGNVITLYNGTTALTQITDNGLPTGTKHGLRIFAGSGSTGNTDRYDDFGVYYG